MAQDDYYYEIQLTNKQLVFYFVAGAMGLILSFLAGVMVGRGVDANGGEVQAAARPAQTIQEDKVVPEPARPASPPAAADMTYSNLENDRTDATLQKPPVAAGKTPAQARPGAEKAAAQTKPGTENAPPQVKPGVETAASALPKISPSTARPASPAPSPAAARPAPSPNVAPPRPAAGAFTVQVGAFKDKATAESIASRLKTRGFTAYVAEGAGGLFNVRVGSYNARADAERISVKLRDEEKFKPFIVPR